MPDQTTLPLQTWAKSLCDAREAQKLNLNETARTLLLSPAQLRCIESGSLAAFHGEGYYLRALEKYAAFLGIELNPAPPGLEQTDSQRALNRFSKSPTVVTLARREATLETAMQMPSGGRSKVRFGVLGLLTVVVLAGVGLYLVLDQPWGSDSAKPEGVTVTTASSPPPSPAKPRAPVSPNPPPTAATVPAPPAPAPTVPEPPAQTSAPSLPPVAATTGPLSTPAAPPTTATGVLGNTTSRPDATSATPPPASITASTAATPTKPIASATPAIQGIEADFKEDCWVEVRFKDGRVEQKIYKPGERLVLPTAGVQSMVFGNAAAVTATLAGTPWSVMAFTITGGNVARISEANLLKP